MIRPGGGESDISPAKTRRRKGGGPKPVSPTEHEESKNDFSLRSKRQPLRTWRLSASLREIIRILIGTSPDEIGPQDILYEIEEVQEYEGLSDKDKAAILGGNALRFYQVA